MRNILNVTFNLDRLICHDEADGWGDAEPYMWTVFFKIDGSTCRLNDALMLEGTATVFITTGSHGNLGDTDVAEGDIVTIPRAIGFQEMSLTPISVPDFVKQLGTEDVAAVAGCIAVLMEEDNVTDDGAEEGHRSLNTAVQSALDSLIPTLGFTNQDISEDDINNLTDQVQSQVINTIRNQQNFFENIWSWVNSDDTIGTVVWKFSGDQLLSQNPIALQQRWQKVWHPLPPGNALGLTGYWKDYGDWELFGSINTDEIPACPADVASSIFDNLFDKNTSLTSMQALYSFRDNEMKKYWGLGLWWQIAQRNSRYLKEALKDKEVANAAFSIFKRIPEILNNKEKSLSDADFENAMKVLKHISSLNEKSRQPRKDIKRTIDALHMLKGKTLGEMFETLSIVRPARYPSVSKLKSNTRL